jgi:hypothetical protein
MAASAGLSGAAPRLLFPLVVFLAALPLTGWPLPTGWLAAMLLLVIGEQAARARRSPSAAPGGGAAGALLSWLSSAGYSLAGLYLVLFYTGVPQTFGVTLYGVVMFQVLARDYADRRRLILNLTPPLISMVAAQTVACRTI